MSSPCRTTSLLVSKESDGWITYKSREKEDTLSLKPNKNGYWIFFLFFLLTFGLLLCFILPFAFLFFFSFLISFLFHFSSFSLFSFHFSPPIWRTLHIRSKEEIASPFPQTKGVALTFPYFSLLSLFPYYDIINHMASYGPWNSFSHTAHCEPFLQVDHMALPSVTLLWCHMASLYLVMCHSTPHTSKNVKSRPPRNVTKFDVVAQFRETISTEKSILSSKI